MQDEESNMDLENFYSAASHDLRTPIRHIKCFTELLSDHLQNSLDNQSRHYLDVISDAATEINVLIDQLLEWARIGSAAMHFSQVDLNPLVSSVINSFEREIADRNVEWDIEKLPAVSGDLNMLRIAFACLVSNALKFTRLQPVARIRIAVEPDLTQKNDIVVSITDNGAGFDLQHAFEGNGIGLATVKRVVQRHGGNVRADSEPGKGTAIYLTFGSHGQEL